MPRNRETLAETFEVVDELGGQQTLSVYQTLIESRPIAGPATWSKGTKRYATARGGHVNPGDDPNTFIELSTGKVLRRA